MVSVKRIYAYIKGEREREREEEVLNMMLYINVLEIIQIGCSVYNSYDFIIEKVCVFYFLYI